MNGNMDPRNPAAGGWPEPDDTDTMPGAEEEETTPHIDPARTGMYSGRKGGESAPIPGGGILSGGDDEDSASVGDLYGDAAVFGQQGNTDEPGDPSRR